MNLLKMTHLMDDKNFKRRLTGVSLNVVKILKTINYIVIPLITRPVFKDMDFSAIFNKEKRQKLKKEKKVKGILKEHSLKIYVFLLFGIPIFKGMEKKLEKMENEFQKEELELLFQTPEGSKLFKEWKKVTKEIEETYKKFIHLINFEYIAKHPIYAGITQEKIETFLVSPHDPSLKADEQMKCENIILFIMSEYPKERERLEYLQKRVESLYKQFYVLYKKYKKEGRLKLSENEVGVGTVSNLGVVPSRSSVLIKSRYNSDILLQNTAKEREKRQLDALKTLYFETKRKF